MNEKHIIRVLPRFLLPRSSSDVHRVGPNRQNPNGWRFQRLVVGGTQPPPTATQTLQRPPNRPTAVQPPSRHPTATQPPIKSPTAANPPNRRRLEGDCGLYDETCEGGEYPCIAGLSFRTPSHPPMPYNSRGVRRSAILATESFHFFEKKRIGRT